MYDNKIAFAFDPKQVYFRFLQHGEETGAQREGLKTMLEEVEFLTGPDIIQQGQLQVILAFLSYRQYRTHSQQWKKQTNIEKSPEGSPSLSAEKDWPIQSQSFPVNAGILPQQMAFIFCPQVSMFGGAMLLPTDDYAKNAMSLLRLKLYIN